MHRVIDLTVTDLQLDYCEAHVRIAPRTISVLAAAWLPNLACVFIAGVALLSRRATSTQTVSDAG